MCVFIYIYVISVTAITISCQRSTRFRVEYAIMIAVILVASLSSYVAEVTDPTVEAINREIYVDKFDNKPWNSTH